MLLRIITFGKIGSWLRSIVATCMLLAILTAIWCVPLVLGSGLFWPRVLSHFTSELEGRVTTEEVKLRWFGPVVARGVRVEDIEGEPVAAAAAIRSESTLLSLLLGGGDFGTIIVEQPEVAIRVRPRGSNLEDVLATYLSGSGSSTGPAGAIHIREGALTVALDRSSEAAAATRFDEMDAVIKLGGQPGEGGSVEIQSCRSLIGDTEGALASTLKWRPDGESTTWSVGVDAQALDLSVLQPAAHRFDLAMDLAGTGMLSGSATWTGDFDRTEIALERAQFRDLRLFAPDYLGRDELKFERVQVEGEYEVSGDVCTITAGQLECDAGRMAVEGSFVRPVSTSDVWAQLIETARQADLRVAGRVDLARLAATLPHTLHIRQGAVIEAGSLTFELNGRRQSDERHWTARVETSELAARRDGERYTWNTPLRITAKASRQSRRWRVEQLACTSSFLSLTGNATPASGSFDLQCDLKELSDQLREFVELGTLQAGGTMSARLNWERHPNQGLTIHGTGLLEELKLDGGMTGHWHEPRLSITLAAQGEQNQRESTILRTARLALASRGDRLEMQLLEPVEIPHSNSPTMIGCYITGQWATWFPRLRPLLPPDISQAAWSVSGPVDAELTLRIAGQRVSVEQGILSSKPFTLDSPHIRIDEPAVSLELEGYWDQASRRLRVPELIFQTRAMAFRMTDFRIDRGRTAARTTGEITFRADLDRLYETWQIPEKQRDWRLSGSAEGQISLIQPGDAMQAMWTIDLVGLELDRRQLAGSRNNVMPAMNKTSWVTVWREPVLNLTGAGQCESAGKRIQLERFKLKSADKLELFLEGTLTEPIGPCVVDFQGQVTYDLAQLMQDWASGLQQRVRWRGRDTQPFWLRGPLFHASQGSVASAESAETGMFTVGMIPSNLQGECGLSWQSAHLFGLGVGGSQMNAQLQNGTMKLGVVETPLSGGTMRIAPAIHFNHRPPTVSLAPGQALSDVQITTDMCSQWLKYVAPVVAAATRAEGTFSLAMDQADIPLRQPTTARAAGTLNVHNARVGPGPLARQLIMLANDIRSLLQLDVDDFTQLGRDTWLRLPEQGIKYRLARQRMHHEQIVFDVGKIRMYTHGSVGFDQSLALQVQIPVQNQWIEGDSRLAALQGQVIRIPVTGTLSEPRVDRRVLERLAADTLRQATGKIIENQFNSALQRLMDSGQ